MSAKICIITIVGVLVMILLPNASALTYEPSNFKLNHNPVICAFEPQDDPNIPNISEKMLALTEYVFDDWKAKLTNGARHSEWDMTLIKVMKSQQNTFDVNQCNIRVSYLPNPNGKINDLEPTGMTQQYTDNTASIEIYYNNYGDGYYTNSLGTDEQLSKTLEHEFGHAFGLSHVILSDQELQNIDTGAEDMPSIMVPYALSVGIHHYSITPSDIDQLKSIYNYQGFGGYAQTTVSSVQSQTTQQISIYTDKQMYYYGDHITITINVSHVTGANASLTLTTSGSQTDGVPIPIAISELQTSITSPYAINETNSLTGTIEARLSYDGQTASTSFQIIGQSSSSVTSQDTIKPRLDPLTEKSHAYDWAVGKLGDDSFTSVVKQWVDEGTIHLTKTDQPTSQTTIPNWVKKDAKLWAQGDIMDIEFFNTLQYLIDNGILRL